MSIEQYKECGVLHTWGTHFHPIQEWIFLSVQHNWKMPLSKGKIGLIYVPIAPSQPPGTLRMNIFKILCYLLNVHDVHQIRYLCFYVSTDKKLHKYINILLTDDVSNQMS